MTAVVSDLHLYPVKSLGGVALASTTVEPAGFPGDRRWMVVDADGATVTARRVPHLLTARAEPLGAGATRLSAPGRDTLVVEVPDGPADVPVTMNRVGTAVGVDPAADAWFSDLVGRPVRLVWQDDPARRGMGPSHGGGGDDPLSFNDAGPLLLTSTASLALLRTWAAELHDERVAAALDLGRVPPEPEPPLAMARFRPNIVVDGELEPFAEDGWGRVRVGEVELRFAEACDRCVLTTVDPLTGLKGPEPLRTLARYRRWDGHVWFGVRFVPVGGGTVRVGDPVVPF